MTKKVKLICICSLILGMCSLTMALSTPTPIVPEKVLSQGVIMTQEESDRKRITALEKEVDSLKARVGELEKKLFLKNRPPRIGKLTMPEPWWKIVRSAAAEYNLCPYWISAVMAIESRFERFAFNKTHSCYGLMQLQKDTAKSLGVTDPFDSEQNIRAGVKILARLEKICGGNKLAVLKKYNPTDTGAYSREVMLAWKQAKENGRNNEKSG